MVALEGILQERLCIPNAIIFRRSTMRRTIQYRVVDSKKKLPLVMAIQFIQQLELPSQKRGVVYVRTYAIGETMSQALGCPFYKAKADDKGQVLEEWKRGVEVRLWLQVH
jgi:superfamily II DNA helicase RecQ